MPDPFCEPDARHTTSAALSAPSSAFREPPAGNPSPHQPPDGGSLSDPAVHLRLGATPAEDVASLGPAAVQFIGHVVAVDPDEPLEGWYIATPTGDRPATEAEVDACLRIIATRFAPEASSGVCTVPGVASPLPFANSAEPPPDAEWKQGR